MRTVAGSFLLALPALLLSGSVDGAIFGGRPSAVAISGAGRVSQSGSAFGLEKSISTQIPRGGSTEVEEAPVEAETLYLPGLMETAIVRSKLVSIDLLQLIDT
jgi:hypothetical protein